MSASDQLDRRKVIEKSVYGRIIPALLARPSPVGSVGNQNAPKALVNQMAGSPQNSVGDDIVPEFARLLLTGDAVGCENLFQKVRDSGVPLQTIMLDLLSPAAALLGEAWVQDTAGFGDVTVGMSILHGLLRRNSDRLRNEVGVEVRRESVFIIPIPLGQHFFGVSMVEEFFRAYGWQVASGVFEDTQEVLDTVSAQHFDVVGISLTLQEDVQRSAEFIARLRRTSKNDKMVVMVGGLPFLERPELAEQVGADMTAANAREAVEKAEEIVAQQNPTLRKL